MSKKIVLVSLSAAILTSPAAWAYQIKKTQSGVPLRWENAPVRMELAIDGTPHYLDRTVTTSTMQASFATWGAQLPNPMAIGAVTTSGTPKIVGDDQVNVVEWISDRWDDSYDHTALAITFVTYDSDSGRISDADVIINADHYQWVQGSFNGCESAYDLQGVLTHEAGHVLGLGHEQMNDAAVMYPTAGTCETAKRTLSDDDMAGLGMIYAPEAPTFAVSLASGSEQGCSVAVGSRAPSSWVALALLFGLGALPWVRRRSRWLPALLCAALAFGARAGVASATTAVGLSLPELGAAASHVVSGRVLDRRATEVGGRIYTDTVIAVDDCWKGACAATVTVRQLGGELGGRGLHVEGQAALPVGGEVVLFLRLAPFGTHRLIGMAQGAFLVRRDAGGNVLALERDLHELTLVGKGGQVHGQVQRWSWAAVRSAAGRE
jgi:MYXO-CTERM domain-containing protein